MNETENKESENQALEEEIEGGISPEFDQFLEEQGSPSELETGQEFPTNDLETEQESPASDLETGAESSDLDTLMDDWGEDDESDFEELEMDEIEEEENDPLGEYKGEPSSDTGEPPTEKVKQLKERISSEKNSKNLDRLGAKFLDKADLFKANLCHQLGGQHIAEYVADDEMKGLLLECIKEYLATREVSELTPFGALMAALAMWTLPPLGVALFDRFQLKKETQTANKQKTSKNLNGAATKIEATEVIEEEELQGEAQTDYSQLKEYQEKRRLFELNTGGKYRKTANGTYISAKIADEYPSPQIKKWIDEGKKAREIKKLLGYGK